MPHAPATTAIIGAGIAGLACGQALQAHGLPVHLFDKARGPGGRMSSRRLEEAAVDLGAQFFSVRDPAFRRAVTAWRKAGVIAPWPDSLWEADPSGWRRHHDDVERLIGVPRMSAVTRHLARELEVATDTRIERLEPRGEAWWLTDQRGEHHGPFARVVLALPSPQAQALLEPHEPSLAAACEAIIQRPCWAAWARFAEPLPALPGVDDDWQAVRLALDPNRVPAEPPLRFVSRNDHKPGRHGQGESLSLLARLEWSEANLEHDAEGIARDLLEAFRARLPAGVTLPEPTALGAHRWRYAQPNVFAGGEAVNLDYRRSPTGLALCGDGWRGPRVEDAWLSGHHLGEALAADAS